MVSCLDKLVFIPATLSFSTSCPMTYTPCPRKKEATVF